MMIIFAAATFAALASPFWPAYCHTAWLMAAMLLAYAAALR